MVYGYARVSTAGQSRDGNSLEEQTTRLKEYGCEKIIVETYSGKTMQRPEFAKLISSLQAGDTLVVTKLDRFARTTVEGVQTIRELYDRDVTVNILNIGTIDNTAVGNLILTVMLAFAEYERDMIVERTQAGKAAAQQTPDYKEGMPPKFSNKQKEHAFELLCQGRTYKEVETLTGISKSTLMRFKKKQI